MILNLREESSSTQTDEHFSSYFHAATALGSHDGDCSDPGVEGIFIKEQKPV